MDKDSNDSAVMVDVKTSPILKYKNFEVVQNQILLLLIEGSFKPLHDATQGPK